jgi:hypothetical protein
MAETKVLYSVDTPIAITLTAPLTTGLFRASAVVDNGTTLYMDAQVGGMIGSLGTSWALGDTVDIYLVPTYSDTATDVGGGIGALLGNGDADEVEDTDFVKANLILIATVSPEVTAPTTDQDYHWFTGSIAQYCGGVMPKKWSLLIHNNTGGSVDSGNLSFRGITYTTT